MKKIVATLIVIGSVIGFAGAQAAGPTQGTSQLGVASKGAGHGNMRKIQQEILAKLNLTTDQKAKLKAHQESMKTKLKALKEETAQTADKTAIKEKMKAFRKEQQDALEAILTTDQKETFKKEMTAAMEKAKADRKNGGDVKKKKKSGV
ncbi:hypothetical protein BH11ARM1_BH11ARM1_13970 [soil metagenome]